MSSNPSALIQTGLQHHQSGDLARAESIYRSILSEQPENPDALHLLGVIALQVGRPGDAVRLIEKAIEVKPEEAQFHNMCGEAYLGMRNHDAAIAHYRQALAIKPEFAGAHNNLGNAFKEAGRLDEAAAAYRQALAIEPDFPMSHNNIGVVLMKLGQSSQALEHLRQAIAIAPDYAEAHTNLGNLQLELGQTGAALECHEKAVEIRPDYAEAHGNFGNALLRAGRLDEALSHYRRAAELRPDFAMAHYNLGIALDELGRPGDAVAAYERAIAIDDGYADAHNNLGNALSELGRRDDAAAHYRQAIALRPQFAEAHRNLTRIAPAAANAELIRTILNNQSLAESDAVHCHFALGNILHAAGDCDAAFEHYASGNALKRRSVTYRAVEFSSYVDRLIRTYTATHVAEVAGCGADAELPVFVIGMPRSGTSLVEQILASHPDVRGAGELTLWRRLEETIAERYAARGPYPEIMHQCFTSVIADHASEYLERLRDLAGGARRITDKMPDNFLRIGLIKTVFPNARIIHCRRDRLDTCTSNFLHYFATGNEYSFDLEDLGRYYLDYERLMSHWYDVFANSLLPVQYETLVAQQETVSRRMIEFIGLAWDDRCLDFHRTERAVNPFSSMQVRKPVYTDSIGRWKHYKKHLGPLLAILGDGGDDEARRPRPEPRTRP